MGGIREYDFPLVRPKKTYPAKPIKYVIRDSGCWEVTSHKKLTKGYPGTYYQGKHILVSRVSWMIYKGEIPNGQCVLHECDNRKCINPEHLFLGTKGDNAHDMKAKGRSLYGDRHHKAQLTDTQVQDIIDRLSIQTRTELAREYGVKRNIVNKIARGTTWKHIPRVREV